MICLEGKTLHHTVYNAAPGVEILGHSQGQLLKTLNMHLLKLPPSPIPPVTHREHICFEVDILMRKIMRMICTKIKPWIYILGE